MPSYNHSREDSPRTPCATCKAEQEALDAARAVTADLVLALREHARATDDGCEDHDHVVDLMIRAADCIEGKVTLPITRYRGPLPGEPGDGESTFAIPEGATLAYVGPPVGEPLPPRRPTFSEISFDGDDAASEVSILRGQLDDANAKIASLEATNAEVEASNDALRAALVEAIDWSADVPSTDPKWYARRDELRALTEPPPTPPGSIRVTFTVPANSRYTLRLNWDES